jgi:hypothetical protein
MIKTAMASNFIEKIADALPLPTAHKPIFGER